LIGLVIEFAGPTLPAGAINIQFDYTYDSAGYFGSPTSPTPARSVLEFAGRAFQPFTDTLAPIQPGGNNNWTAVFTNPSQGGDAFRSNLIVPADTVIVFVGTRDLGGETLGEGGLGRTQFSIPGSSPSFINSVFTRNQGSAEQDFAGWGGHLIFDTLTTAGGPRNWHFDLNAAPPANAHDFYSAAAHELAHVLGFGTSTAFAADRSNGRFTGPTVQAMYGSAPPLHSGNQHWATTVGAPPYALGTRPKPAMSHIQNAGERKLFSPLDYAAMKDIGWLVTPEQLRLPGDADFDHDVDGTDFLLWQRNLGGFGGSLGDVNGDLIVDDYDGWIIRQNFGAIGTGSSFAMAPSAQVPEPATSLLVAGAVIALTTIRQKD
jgi:hypothetical protein